MWDQWKEKIKNIFTKEVEIEVEEIVETKPSDFRNGGKQQLKAKMTYQYPERNAFRFPVIPDEPQTNKAREDIPAYQKKQSKRQERSSQDKEKHNNQHRKDGQTSSGGEEKAQRIEPREKSIPGRKVYKKDPSIPFQPTEVPSPIYGFQKRRQNEEIEQIPAYKRKELNQDISDQTSSLSSEIQKNILPSAGNEPASVHRINNRDSENVKAKETEPKEDIPSENTLNSSLNLHKEEAAAAIESREDRVSDGKDDLNEAKREQERQRKMNPISSRENRRAFDRRTGESKSEPFNVLMTPRDKKNLFDKQKRTAASERQNTPIRPVEAESRKSSRQNLDKPYFEREAADRKRDVLGTQATSDGEAVQETAQQSDSTHEPVEVQQVIIPEQKIHVPYHLLNDPVGKNTDDQLWVNEQQQLLEQTLKYFNVRAKVVKATQGPSVTRFEVQPEMGVKVSKIKNLSDDLKLNMSAKDIRIEAPIPGKNTVGIEVPNLKAEMVGLQGIFETADFRESKSPLSIALGLTIEGYPKITNVQKMPHGLIAGATGSGKSVCINTILISLIYKASHEDVKFLLIDPKMVELAPYNGIPHLVAPVITDVKAATQSLKWAVGEMEERYEKFVQEGVRDIERYNQKVVKQGRADKKMPFIIIVIDELADLMMMSPQDVEDSISRIAQKARACGIHLLLATQRPSVDVITGLIKANIPTRIAFSVSSQIDSRTILDSSGAEKLLGKGDMLFVENGAGKSVRLQGPFVSDEEIERVTAYARTIAEPNYLFEQEELLEQLSMDEDVDELMDEAIQFILNQNSASTSLLQRHFKIGYNRAARLIDSLEGRGIISGQNGSKPRDVLIAQNQLEEF
ncbi:DNA translocase FtsK [Oceanobacillus massiliensis]|uniref:DNA translocase FtsK n=1 Tax=Oceanobacillus massiliensis TaxID=1465765 RepID=UPI000287CD7E|nr:DNA translocase FtsK [Oceanobacillus massiliensis]